MNYISLFKTATIVGLLASWPFLSFIGNNLGHVANISDVLFPWVVWVCLIITIFAMAAHMPLLTSRGGPPRYIERFGILIGALSVCFFSFSIVGKALSGLGITLGTLWMLGWITLTFCIGVTAWRLSRNQHAQKITMAIIIGMAIWPSLKIAFYHLSHQEAVTAQSVLSPQKPDELYSTLPNVYWFVLDGYIRADTLKTYFDFEDDAFLAFLSKNGFQIGHKSYSNYDNTTFSLGSTLSTNYTFLPGEKRPPSQMYTSLLSGHNTTVQTFLDLGYHYVHGPYSGSAKTQCGGLESHCIRAPATGKLRLNDTQIGILQLTPLFRILRRALPETIQYDHLFVEDVTSGLSKIRKGPIFVFAHILSPHSPPRYTDDCARIKKVESSIDVGEGFYDGTQFTTDTRCTALAVQVAIDEILDKRPQDAIIIIQGDHGFKFSLPHEPGRASLSTTEAVEPVRRLAILNAMKLPKRCSNYFYPEISPVNTFRLVFACLTGRQPHLLPDRHFVRPRLSADRVIEVFPGDP